MIFSFYLSEYVSMFQPLDECCIMDRVLVTSLILLTAIFQALTYGMARYVCQHLMTNHCMRNCRKKPPIEMILTGMGVKDR